MIENIFIGLLLIGSAAFAIGSSMIIAEDKEKARKLKEHLNNLPKFREDKPGPFDKSNVKYFDGDNT